MLLLEMLCCVLGGKGGVCLCGWVWVCVWAGGGRTFVCMNLNSDTLFYKDCS